MVTGAGSDARDLAPVAELRPLNVVFGWRQKRSFPIGPADHLYLHDLTNLYGLRELDAAG